VIVRVAVYAIALDEIRHVDRFLRTCSGADVVVVADTGSIDGTVEAMCRGGACVYNITIRPWRFDDARNAALALVPADIDVCVSLDLDEVLSDGWRAALEAAWTPETTLGRYRHIAAHLADGSPAVEMSGSRIHSRFGYRWRHLIHEQPVADRLKHPRETWLPGLELHHWPDRGKDRRSYLALMEAAVAEAPDDPRNAFLLGRDYVNLGRWTDGETQLRRYLELAGTQFPVQRASAWRRIARCRLRLGDSDGALAALNEGLSIVPDGRDLWLDAGDLHAQRGDWPASYDSFRRGLAIPITPGAVANDLRHAGGRPFYCASVAALEIGRLPEALELASAAIAREPNQEVYRRHLRELEERLVL
jgi:tetratricopeptide (TPR) repeat protein